MCSHHLDGAVDIHGGGADLIFPHHENEIAQSEAFLGKEPFSRYWVHNGLLQFAGDKMSKSIGNIVRLRDVLDRGLAGAFRLMVLQSHYRAPLTYTEEGLEAAERGLDRLRAAATAAATGGAVVSESTIESEAAEARRIFHDCMDNDFDTPGAIAALFDLARAINRARDGNAAADSLQTAVTTLLELSGVLGLDLTAPAATSAGDAAPFIDLLLKVREQLRSARQWAIADTIRDGLAAEGITIADGATGSTWRKA